MGSETPANRLPSARYSVSQVTNFDARASNFLFPAGPSGPVPIVEYCLEIWPVLVQPIFVWPIFHKGRRLPVVSAHRVDLRTVFASRRSAPAIVLGLALFTSPARMHAQHGGGGRSQPGANSKPIICVHDCVDPHTGLGPDDDRNLERLMAVQATPEQTTSFNALLKDVEAARDRLQAFIKLEQAPAPSAPSDPPAMLDQTIEKVRTSSHDFLASFSPVQKSGLKDVTKKVETADSELDKQRTAFDRILQTAKADSPPVAASAGNLDSALASFQNQQLALGGEMSIVLPSNGQDLSFILPSVKTAIDIAGQSISIPLSGATARASAADSHDQFSLRVVADFSDLQQNITGVLRSLLTRSPRCGERLEIQHASLIPQDPASLVVMSLHFERWICQGGSPMELASSEGTVEVKLTPSIDRSKIEQTKIEQNKIEQNKLDQNKTGPNLVAQPPVEPNSIHPYPSLHLASEFGRVDADGLFRESLVSGSLGDTVREQVAAALFPAMATAANLKAALPPVARDSATLRKAQFQDAGAGQLRLVLDGQLQLSDEQTKQFAVQLKQPMSAQQTSPP
jgi:hypothetical protein